MADIVGKSGISIPAANVIRSVTLPNLDSLFAEFLLGVDFATSKKNRAGGSDLIALSGASAPTYSAGYITVNGGTSLGATAGLDSTIVAPDTVTVAVLQRKAVADGFGNGLRIFGTDNTGIGGNGAATNYFSFWNGLTDGASDDAHVAYGGSDTDFHLVVGSGVIGAIGNIRTYSGGVASNDAGTAISTPRGSSTFKIGGFVDASKTGSADVAWCAAFGRILSNSEIDDIYASIKTFGASRGLSVS